MNKKSIMTTVTLMDKAKKGDVEAQQSLKQMAAEQEMMRNKITETTFGR